MERTLGKTKNSRIATRSEILIEEGTGFRSERGI